MNLILIINEQQLKLLCGNSFHCMYLCAYLRQSTHSSLLSLVLYHAVSTMHTQLYINCQIHRGYDSKHCSRIVDYNDGEYFHTVLNSQIK